MTYDALTAAEDELLAMLEGKQAEEKERFRALVERLLARHWDDLLGYVQKRCFDADISAEEIVVDTCMRATDILTQQLAQHYGTPTAEMPLLYSRTRCPQFLGFVKALAHWKHLDAARKAGRYRTVIDRLGCQARQQAQQYGTRRSSTGGERVPLLTAEPTEAAPTALWECVRMLPSRERLVVWLYFYHGPEPLTVHEFTVLVSNAGLERPQVCALQRRFRRLLRLQQVKTICHLTHESLAILFDVDRETIRRTLLTARQHLRATLETEGP